MPSTLPKVELPAPPPPKPNAAEVRTTSVERERQALEHGFTKPSPEPFKTKFKKKIKNEIKKALGLPEAKLKTNIRLPASRVSAVDDLSRHLHKSLKERYPGRPLRWRKEDTYDLALQLLLNLSEDEALDQADGYIKSLYTL
jgi:hypothetical protein